jgi:vacuolar protein sorting-associated protein 13D
VLLSLLLSLLQVSISCSFWLINRTGLPLLFKQEGLSTDAAGQQEEHEKASTTTPLLFSYSEGEFVEK